jgi:soluble lytic murein transglycosylase-like protein
MFHTLIRVLALMVLLAIMANGQSRTEVGPPLPERERQLERYIVESARRNGIDPRILRALCFMESRYRLDAVSPKGARGPMQLMPDTARRYGVTNPHDPKQAIEAAAQYMRDLLAKFGGRLDLALAAYNAGEGTVDSFLSGRPLLLPSGKVINPHRLMTGGLPPYRETQDYVRLGLALFSNRERPAAKSANAPSLAEKTTARFGNRDFTLDVTVETNQTARKARPRSASFIDVP